MEGRSARHFLKRSSSVRKQERGRERKTERGGGGKVGVNKARVWFGTSVVESALCSLLLHSNVHVCPTDTSRPGTAAAAAAAAAGAAALAGFFLLRYLCPKVAAT